MQTFFFCHRAFLSRSVSKISLGLLLLCSLFNLRSLLVLGRTHTHTQTARKTKRYKNIAQHYARAPQAAVFLLLLLTSISGYRLSAALLTAGSSDSDRRWPGFGLAWLGLARSGQPEAPRLNDVFWAPQK